MSTLSSAMALSFSRYMRCRSNVLPACQLARVLSWRITCQARNAVDGKYCTRTDPTGVYMNDCVRLHNVEINGRLN